MKENINADIKKETPKEIMDKISKRVDKSLNNPREIKSEISKEIMDKISMRVDESLNNPQEIRKDTQKQPVGKEVTRVEEKLSNPQEIRKDTQKQPVEKIVTRVEEKLSNQQEIGKDTQKEPVGKVVANAEENLNKTQELNRDALNFNINNKNFIIENYFENSVNEKIDNIKKQQNKYEVGHIIKVTNFIIEVVGIDNLSFFEQVNIENYGIGYVTSILENSVIIAVLKSSQMIKVGDKVYSTGKSLMTYFSNQFVGRIVDMFGTDLYSNKQFDDLVSINIENPPVPIMDRGRVNRPFETGISGIDLIYPIGKGQRQLIVGDKQTGKTQICLDAITNQKNKKVLCIYVAIGKTKKEVKNIYLELQKRGALAYTMLICAFNDDKPPVISLTPYAALSIAEVYMKSKHDVLVVIDDLKRHAEAYREISLVSGKTPGRDAYPADIFYTHSRLLEKGCQHKNGGSITILPIVETKAEDMTDYITTNIISITDGQIYLSSKLFTKGFKPAIDYGLSVSRLGGAVQTNDIKKLGAVVRLKLLSYLETQDVYQFANVDEMGENLRRKIDEGKKILDLLNQYKFSPKKKEQIIDNFKFVLEGNNEG